MLILATTPLQLSVDRYSGLYDCHELPLEIHANIVKDADRLVPRRTFSDKPVTRSHRAVSICFVGVVHISGQLAARIVVEALLVNSTQIGEGGGTMQLDLPMQVFAVTKLVSRGVRSCAQAALFRRERRLVWLAWTRLLTAPLLLELQYVVQHVAQSRWVSQAKHDGGLRKMRASNRLGHVRVVKGADTLAAFVIGGERVQFIALLRGELIGREIVAPLFPTFAYLETV